MKLSQKLSQGVQFVQPLNRFQQEDPLCFFIGGEEELKIAFEGATKAFYMPASDLKDQLIKLEMVIKAVVQLQGRSLNKVVDVLRMRDRINQRLGELIWVEYDLITETTADEINSCSIDEALRKLLLAVMNLKSRVIDLVYGDCLERNSSSFNVSISEEEERLLSRLEQGELGIKLDIVKCIINDNRESRFCIKIVNGVPIKTISVYEELSASGVDTPVVTYEERCTTKLSKLNFLKLLGSYVDDMDAKIYCEQRKIKDSDDLYASFAKLKEVYLRRFRNKGVLYYMYNVVDALIEENYDYSADRVSILQMISFLKKVVEFGQQKGSDEISEVDPNANLLVELYRLLDEILYGKNEE